MKGTLFLIDILEFNDNRHLINSNSKIHTGIKDETNWNYFKEIIKLLFESDLINFMLQIKNFLMIIITIFICFLIICIIIKLRFIFKIYKYLFKLILIFWIFTFLERGGAIKPDFIKFDKEDKNFVLINKCSYCFQKHNLIFFSESQKNCFLKKRRNKMVVPYILIKNNFYIDESIF